MIEFTNKHNDKFKTTCGATVWRSRSVAVCAMIRSNDDSILITKRSDTMDTNPGKWCLPCGYLDYNESIHQALIREVLEEVGLNIDKECAILYHINDAPGSDHLENITFHFLIDLPINAADIPITLSDEVSTHAWLSHDDIMADKFEGKEAAFGHFKRIKKVAEDNIDSPIMMHAAWLNYTDSTQFSY